MRKTIVLLCRDEDAQRLRASVLERAGYYVHQCMSFSDAATHAARSQMVIAGHTYTSAEQEDLVSRVHETNPSFHMLCLRFNLIEPKALLHACQECFASQPGGSRVFIIQAPRVISWPGKAH